VESKSRILLAWSFGALILLAAATGAASLAAFEKIRAGEASLRARFADRAALLERVRRGVSLAAAPALEADSQRAAAEYGESGLRAELDLYWKTVHLMMDVTASRPRTAGLDSYFTRQLALRRESAERVAGEIEAALVRERERAEAAHAAMYRRFRWGFGGIVALAVILGAAVSFAAIRRLMRLEREARALAAQAGRAQEEERKRIARELHDEVGQSLSRLLLDAGNLPAIREQAEGTLEAVRRIALALRPSMLDDLGLVAALEWQAREVGKRSGLDVQVDAEESAGEVPEHHATCIYRVAREALENCARHAAANRVTIGLQRVNGTVSLEVRDDGRGFHAARTRGMGLVGMEERVAQLGGRLVVKSAPGHGTTVTVEIPL
jgi:signal transduction histidine kinase